MKNSLVLTALLIAQLLPSQTFGQVDSIATLNEQEKVLIKEAGNISAGDHLQRAGRYKNASIAVLFGSGTTAYALIAADPINGPTASIIGVAGGLVSLGLNIAGNMELIAAGKSNLNSTKPKSRDRYTISKSQLLLELKPTFSRRNANGWFYDDVNQSLLGGANMRYSFNDNFIRLGLVTGITKYSYSVNEYFHVVSPAGLIEMGKAFNKNELSIGVTVSSQRNNFNFFNLSYSRDLTDKLGLGLDLRYDYAAYSYWPDYRLFPSVSLSYDVILKKS